MSALYSQAFDHLPGSEHENNVTEEDYTYQDPEFTPSFSSFSSSRGESRTTAFKIKQPNEARWNQVPHDEMGQSTSLESDDVFGNHASVRRQQWRSQGPDSVRRGHRNEETEEYCYSEISPDMPPMRNKTQSDAAPVMRNKHLQAQVPQRSVSLKDDYSHPPDRLSNSGTTQDYIEPYQSQGNAKKVNCKAEIPIPDPGGFYSLAKDVEDIRETGPPERNSVKSDNYNHLTHSIQQLNVSQPDKDRYDSVNSWKERMNRLASTDSGSEHFVSAESSPVRKSSNVSDSVFLNPAIVNPVTVNKDSQNNLPGNYEDPWDSEEGQRKFSMLMGKAEKKHEQRHSIDKQAPGARQSTDNKDKGATAGDVNLVSPKSPTTKKNFETEYGTAWGNKGQASENPAISAKPKPVVQPKPHAPVVGNYEDAWDLPEKQKEFEEKLLQARKQRTSQGQIREEDVPQRDGRLASVSSQAGQKQASPGFIRSDSCRSLGALAEKIDIDIPLDGQSFYHGSIKRSVAEKKLVVFNPGSYLIRRSETSKKDFSLTLKGWTGQPMHMKIACKPDGYVLGENSPLFETIPEMVDYYSHHELPVQNAERICLLYPVPR